MLRRLSQYSPSGSGSSAASQQKSDPWILSSPTAHRREPFLPKASEIPRLHFRELKAPRVKSTTVAAILSALLVHCRSVRRLLTLVLLALYIFRLVTGFCFSRLN